MESLIFLHLTGVSYTVQLGFSGWKVNWVGELLEWADCGTKFLGGQAACAQSRENPAKSLLQK